MNALCALNILLHPQSGDDSDIMAAIDVAIQELKHRIPTKVTHVETLRKSCTCPNCKNVVDTFEKFGDSIVRVRHKYCPICGQALDWSDIYDR